jgi:uncharacterized protein YggE
MKRLLWSIGACLLLTLVLIGTLGCEGITSPPATSGTGQIISSQETGIWVSGTGEVAVSPDIAVLQVGVEAQEDTVAEARDEAANAMARVSEALISRGVAPEDIQTQYFSISQRTRWDNETGEETVTGYRVANTVTIKIRTLMTESVTLDYKTSLIIDDVVAAGGDLIRINDLSFTVEDPSDYYDEARELATADALAKAQKLAEQTGVEIGDPTYVSESAYMPSIYSGLVYGLGEMAVPAPTIVTPTSPGQVNVTLTVEIAYAIK